MDFAHMAMRGAIAYSAFRRSKTHLVYTTEDLRVRFVDRTHFFGRAHPEKRAYALPIGKVGLALPEVRVRWLSFYNLPKVRLSRHSFPQPAQNVS